MAKGSKEAKVLFTAEVSQFTKGITQINKSLSNLKSDLKACNADLKANGNSYETLSNKQQTLRKVIDQLTDKLEAQEKCLQSAKEILGEGSEQYNRYYRAINNTKAELTKFQRELQDTERALDGLNDEMEEVDGGTLDLNNGLSNIAGGMKGASTATIAFGSMLGNLASSAISFCVDKLAEFGQWLWDLPEATEEFRTQMAKLDSATKQYGYSTLYTGSKVKEMYGYLNDEQMAVNAITNLQGLGLTQEDLNATIDASVAVWTAYGDSIPIESLTESINETAQVGKVTGSLADALNWAGISEDEFNKKLEGTKTTQERAKLITDTLNGAYGESKKKFDEATESTRAYREECFSTTEKSAELAEALTTVKTEVERLKGKALDAATPAIISICNALQEFSKWCVDVKEKVQELQQSPAWQFLKQVAEVFIQPVIAKFKVLWEVVKTVIEVCKLLWSGLSSLANMFATLLQKYKPFQDAFGKLSGMFKTANSSANPLISTLQKLQGKLQTAREWIQKVSQKWSFSNPQLPSGLQKFINKANEVYGWIKKITKKITLSISLGKLPKLPTPKITGKFSLNPPSVPRISWNAVGGIFTKPTILNTRAGLQGVGEAGHEAILPLDSFYNHLDNTIANSNNIDYDRMTQSFISAMQNLDIEVVMNSTKVAKCIAGDLDKIQGTKQKLYERGVNI